MQQHLTTQNTLKLDDVTLDVEHRRVTAHNGTFHLTPIECQLLRVLMMNHDQVVHRAVLMKKVWETDFVDDTRTIDVHISWLRKKIEKNPRRPRYLRTIRGRGFSFKLI